MKTFYRLTLAAALVAFAAATASAQATETLTINATVTARATIVLSVGSISFADADPATDPTITASAVVSVSARSRVAHGSTVDLTISAPDLSETGGGVIPADQISWTATGDLLDGTLSNSDVTLVTSSNSGMRSGNMSFTLVNSWDYDVGSYSTTVTYTLSAT